MSEKIKSPATMSDIKAMLETTKQDGSIGRYIELRHMLTENVTRNLYKGASKDEGREALKIRNALDETIFKSTANDLMAGSNPEGLAALKEGITIENLAEQFEFMEQVVKAGEGKARKIQSEMKKLTNDPDRFARFSAEHQQMIALGAKSTPFELICEFMGVRIICNLMARGRAETVLRSLEAQVSAVKRTG